MDQQQQPSGEQDQDHHQDYQDHQDYSENHPSQESTLDRSRNPLALPEIRLVLGQFLENNDLLSLILVSHAFYNDLVPFLWSTLVFDADLQQAITKELFQQHEHSIRKLTLYDHGTFLEYWQGDNCRNLKALDILPDTSVPRRMTLEEFNEGAALAETASEDEDKDNNESDLGPDIETGSTNRAELSARRRAVPCGTTRLARRTHGLIDLIKRQRNLTTLKLNWVAMSPAFVNKFAPRLYALANQLVTLQLFKWTIQLVDLNILIRNSPSLQEISARGLFVEGDTKRLDSGVLLQEMGHGQRHGNGQGRGEGEGAVLDFAQIRRLQFHHIVLRISPLLINCPSAESIQLSGYGNQYDSHQDKLLRRGHSWNCPRLRKLRYTGQVDETEARNEYSRQGALSDMLQSSASSTSAALLSTTPAGSSPYSQPKSTTATSTDQQQQPEQHRGLRRIALTCCLELGQGGSGLWSRAQALHGSTFETIDLSYSTGLSSLDILSILTTCDKLKRFQGSEDYLWDSDLEGLSSLGPWKCLGLERLQIRFGLTLQSPHPIGSAKNAAGFSGGDGDVSPRSRHQGRSGDSPVTEQEQEQVDAMYEQLARLKHLTVLDLSGYGSTDTYTRGIPLTMSRGLDKLKGLQHIQTVHVTGWEKEMGQAEAEWMIKHWHGLENIYTLHNKNDGEWKRFLGCLREARVRNQDEMELHGT